MKAWSTTLRSVGVGIIATAVDLLVLGLSVEVLAVDPRIANLPALLLGVAAQFFGNKYLAFEDRSSAWVRQGALFAAVEVLALLINASLYHFAIALGAPYLIARLVCQAVVYLGVSLPLWSRIFAKRSTS